MAGLEADNNLTEQEIKPFVIARKNFMFCSSVSGANALCLHFSYDLILRASEIISQQNICHIPCCESVEDYEALLPWNIELEKAGALKAAA